jgi:DNA repair exonuclease SbcCD ATPase subunit
MHIKGIQIENFMKFEHLDLTPGKITRIRGRNGSGKSTVQNALRTALGCGQTAELLRKDADGSVAEEGEIVLVFDNDMKVRRRFTSNGSDDTVVTHPERGKMQKPMAILKKIADMIAVDPMRLLTASDKDRAKYLLEAITVELSPAEVEVLKAAGIDTDSMEFADHLGWLSGTRKGIEELRRDINRNAKEKSGEIAGLEETLPKRVEAADITAIENELDHQRSEYVRRTAENSAKRQNAANEITLEFQPKKDKIDAEYAKKLKKLNEWKASELKAIADELTANIDSAHSILTAELADVVADCAPKIDELSAKVAAAREQQSQAVRYDEQRKRLSEMRTKVEQLEGRSSELTQQIQAIDSVKLSLMGRLPIKGLEVVDGDVRIDGFPWSDVNTARKVEVAFDLGALRMGDLRIMTIDDAEHLDSEMLQEVERHAAKRGIQLFLAIVDDTDLVIEDAEGVGV